jgi:hypothetical protein
MEQLLIHLPTFPDNAVDRGIVATLTEVKSRLTKQLEDTSQSLKEIGSLKERNKRSSRNPFAPSKGNYCCTRGYTIAINQTSENC